MSAGSTESPAPSLRAAAGAVAALTLAICVAAGVVTSSADSARGTGRLALLAAAYSEPTLERFDGLLHETADFDELRRELQEADVPSGHVLAALALEFAHAAYVSNSSASRGRTRLETAQGLLEYGCRINRQLPRGSPLRAAWSAASLAVISGDSLSPADRLSAVRRHLDHLEGDVPEGSLLLAWAVHREQQLLRFTSGAGRELAFRTDRTSFTWTSRRRQGDSLLRWSEAALKEADKHAAVHPEATIRLGHLATVVMQFRQLDGQQPSGQRALTILDSQPDSALTPDLRYLKHLFRGRVFELTGQTDAAIRAFAMAVEVVPAQAASMALASHAYLTGDVRRAEAVTDRTLRVRPPDPWLSYFGGAYQTWPSRRIDLHGAVR